jgi:hypothetical protein
MRQIRIALLPLQTIARYAEVSSGAKDWSITSMVDNSIFVACDFIFGRWVAFVVYKSE